jgi:hypothetical protein
MKKIVNSNSGANIKKRFGYEQTLCRFFLPPHKSLRFYGGIATSFLLFLANG